MGDCVACPWRTIGFEVALRLERASPPVVTGNLSSTWGNHLVGSWFALFVYFTSNDKIHSQLLIPVAL